MIYNFLDPKLKPIVKCSVPCTEGYDATNLISEDTDLKSKGFLAYSPIKPPVDIEFEFICSIDLYNIIIWPTVGVQKSVGFEVLVSNGSGNYETFCNGVIRNKEPGLVFYNGRKYHQRAVNNILENVRNFSHYAFKSNQWRFFTSCTKMKVRILRTDNSVPCLGKIEAWGVVSRACSEKTKESINRMYIRDSVSTNNSEVLQNMVASQYVRETKAIENSFQIPEEFLDPITLEVMILPVTLPSGKTIDQCTLEKHNRYQDTWLRSPFDPFTGIPFTENRKPVFNSALKNRIDHFLFLHQDRPEVKKCSRTIGSGAPVQIPEFYKKRSSTSSTSDLHKETMLSACSSEESDLSNALTSTLSKIKRFATAAENDTKDSNKILTCSACKKIDSLYKLACNHFLCRNCLVKLESSEGENACNVCFCLFKKSEVIKVHSTNY